MTEITTIGLDLAKNVFQIHAGIMPSATKALQRQAAFMKQQWGV